MNSDIALMLVQDGVTSGAIYALISLALLLVFTVTRVILVPQGQFVTYGALTYAMLAGGQAPGTGWLLLGLGLAAAALDLPRALRRRDMRGAGRIALRCVVLPGLLLAISLLVPPERMGLAGQVALTLALVVPTGPLLYRLVFEPLADASVLVLLIVAVALDFALGGVGLLLFGPEGTRTDPLFDLDWSLGPLTITGQNVEVVGVSVLLMLGLFLFFGRTVYGKALRAMAINRLGARLVGIGTRRAGRLCFGMAAFIGAVSGILISSVVTVYYDSGFLIGLKGFVAAIMGGLVSYPEAVLASLAIGVLETFSGFYASAFKEVIVFTALIPVLLLRSIGAPVLEEEEEEA